MNQHFSNEREWMNHQLYNSKPSRIPDFGYHGDLDLGETWGALGFSLNRDSREPLYIANRIYVEQTLQNRYGSRFWQVESFDHFGPGWVDAIFIQMKTKKGKMTKITQFCFDEFIAPYQKYPVLHDDLHYAVEYFHNLYQIHDAVRSAISDEVVERLQLAEEQYPSAWDELGKKYPELLALNEYKEYPDWVHDVFGVLCSVENGPMGDYGLYSYGQAEAAALGMGLLGTEEDWSERQVRDYAALEYTPLVLARRKPYSYMEVVEPQLVTEWIAKEACIEHEGIWYEKKWAIEQGIPVQLDLPLDERKDDAQSND